MRLLEAVFVLVGLSIASTADARSQPLVWSEWEASAVEKRGPERAQAVLVYFHGRAPWDVTKNPIMGIFIEMARVAEWDVLRINRNFLFDWERYDDGILRFVADRVADLRRDGYKKVIVGGGSGGGWLSLLASALPGIDAALAFAPGTTSGRKELLRTGRKLGRILAGAKAPRIAVFFFEGDFLEEEVEIRRSYMIRGGLEKTASTFMIVDHPPDLYGHQAMGTGRIVRRYRDCLLRLVRDADLPSGEIECVRSTGFAVGSEIGFPPSTGSVRLLSDANPALLPYGGRWEGDDEEGAYFILEAVQIGSNDVDFRMGYSDVVGGDVAPWIEIYPFQLNRSDGSVSFKSPDGSVIFTLRLLAATELEMTMVNFPKTGESTTYDIRLRRRTEDPGHNHD
jgi:hypothetical protein